MAIETVGDLKKALEGFDDNARIKVNFGHAGDFCPENSPIIDVKQSSATYIVYIKTPYNLVRHNCGKSLKLRGE